MRHWLSVSLFIIHLTGISQSITRKIDISRIPQHKVRTLIANQTDNSEILNMDELSASYEKGQDIKKYHIIESYYRLRESPDEVWNIYQETCPAESWNGKMVSFALLVSKNDNLVLYGNDNCFNGIDTGQVFYINLRLLKGLYNMAVALEIINIDVVNKSVTFSYLKGGKSRGEQTIYFLPTKKGYTRILHQTAFKSGKLIRDNYLYPWFHRKIINEFHRNMKRNLYADANWSDSGKFRY